MLGTAHGPPHATEVVCHCLDGGFQAPHQCRDGFARLCLRSSDAVPCFAYSPTALRVIEMTEWGAGAVIDSRLGERVPNAGPCSSQHSTRLISGMARSRVVSLSPSRSCDEQVLLELIAMTNGLQWCPFSNLLKKHQYSLHACLPSCLCILLISEIVLCFTCLRETYRTVENPESKRNQRTDRPRRERRATREARHQPSPKSKKQESSQANRSACVDPHRLAINRPHRA